MNTEAMVKDCQSLVRSLAGKVYRETGYQVEFNDLVQVGYLAVIEYGPRHQPEKGASLKTYLSTRVWGAMMDEARKRNPNARSVGRFFREQAYARKQLIHRLNREPNHQEMAQAMGMTYRQYLKRLYDPGITLTPLPGEDEHHQTLAAEDDVTHQLETQEKVNKLHTTISRIKQRIIQLLLEEITTRDVCKALGVSEGRVSQLKRTVLEELRVKMGAQE